MPSFTPPSVDTNAANGTVLEESGRDLRKPEPLRGASFEDPEKGISMRASSSGERASGTKLGDHTLSGDDAGDDERTMIADTILHFDRPDDFPEGGTHAWLAVFGGFWCLFWSFGLVNTFGVYEEYYLRTFLRDKSSSQIAWIGAFQYGFPLVMGPFVGRLFDAGYLRSTFAVGAGLWVVCHMLLSLCRTYAELFLAQGLGIALGCGVLFNLGVMVPSHWFLRRRAYATGIVAAGSSLGGTILPIAARKLIDNYHVDFPWCMRIFGFMGLATFIPSYFALRQRLAPQISFANGGWKQIQWINFGEFKSVVFTLLTLGAFLLFLTFFNVWTYLDIFTTIHRVPKGEYFLSIINAASTFGRVLPGFVADKVGRFNVMIPMCAIASTMLFVFPLATHLRGLIPVAIIYGSTSGAYISLLPSCLAQIGPTSGVGTRIGTSYLVVSLAGIFGTPIGGAILGSNNDRWWPLMLYSGSLAMSGTAVLLCVRMIATKRQVRVKF